MRPRCSTWLVWVARIALLLAGGACCCNLYEGRSLDVFAEAVEPGAECRDDLQCPRERAYCARGACVECVVDTDCREPRKPACVGNTCVECRSASDCAMNEGCNDVLSACAPACDSPSGCAGQRASRCSNELDVCVECLSDADCTEPRRPACDRGGVCVECLGDTHCTPDRPSCRLSTRSCVECTDSSQCGDGRVCDARDARCVECSSDADCENGTCDTERRRCEAPCAGPLDCGGRRPLCNPAGLCVECSPEVACPDPRRPACTAEQQCVECLSDEHCTDAAKPACLAVTQRCGECTSDAHCGPERRCELAAARCVGGPPVSLPSMPPVDVGDAAAAPMSGPAPASPRP